MHRHNHQTGQILKWSFLATVLFVLVELFAGIRAGSLALMSDAGHNFTDALSLVLASIGRRDIQTQYFLLSEGLLRRKWH